MCQPASPSDENYSNNNSNPSQLLECLKNASPSLQQIVTLHRKLLESKSNKTRKQLLLLLLKRLSKYNRKSLILKKIMMFSVLEKIGDKNTGWFKIAANPKPIEQNNKEKIGKQFSMLQESLDCSKYSIPYLMYKKADETQLLSINDARKMLDPKDQQKIDEIDPAFTDFYLFLPECPEEAIIRKRSNSGFNIGFISHRKEIKIEKNIRSRNRAQTMITKNTKMISFKGLKKEKEKTEEIKPFGKNKLNEDMLDETRRIKIDSKRLKTTNFISEDNPRQFNQNAKRMKRKIEVINFGVHRHKRRNQSISYRPSNLKKKYSSSGFRILNLTKNNKRGSWNIKMGKNDQKVYADYKEPTSNEKSNFLREKSIEKSNVEKYFSRPKTKTINILNEGSNTKITK